MHDGYIEVHGHVQTLKDGDVRSKLVKKRHKRVCEMLIVSFFLRERLDHQSKSIESMRLCFLARALEG